ncbi:fluoride efflux transporter CrcB [Liquorilactobacillus satsumensis]|uniref:Fluoride-specific ion channel FluC n=1 Tax=Liquorilactobacillus satsumensis DSM 16230 = JCM 12392 TaxID=1423801 RepID=A0A0R1V4T9_9LACO|nr:fluoride efflux transporter CrcB [Liquorilactobacillus satsumensis]KRL98858.1 hypothetical protein FD50_GL000671 [Liquorilactobacillus satsumensis DSM 16230 = JCM 12392]MCP9327959.1 fluoride efflux transporter CrcB [Liquorilactobacillus satsumensis]
MIYLVGLGSAIGSLLRFEVTRNVKRRYRQNWPLATFLINLSGAFLLGFIFGLHLTQVSFAFLGTGIVGGFTTFSTLNTEVLGLFNNQHVHTGTSYLLFSYLGGGLLIFSGYFLGSLV